MQTTNDYYLSLILMIISSIGAIICLIWACRLIKKDNEVPVNNPLNDIYFYDVWEQDKPKFIRTNPLTIEECSALYNAEHEDSKIFIEHIKTN